MSSRSGRANSTPWSRLKPVNLDPLEAIGLPSKGDNRLLDFKTQERYYQKIVDRYMSFCSETGRDHDLIQRLDALSVNDLPARPQPQVRALKTPNGARVSVESDVDSDGKKDLNILIMAMRKLREGIVASKRIDDWSIQAYIFCIRLAILSKHMESYHPALLHLLYTMHQHQPLSKTDLQEFAGYLVLDLACRQQDLANAHRVRVRFGLRDRKVGEALYALTHDDYDLYWRVRRSVDAHKARLMEWAEEGVRVQALKCLGRAYLSIDLEFLEKVTDCTWPLLIAEHKVGWELDGKKVVIRKLKAR